MSTADDAWQEWEAEHYGARGANAETQRLFKSAYRRALEDAAAYAEAVDEDGDRPGLEATGVWDSAPDELTELLMRPDGLELLTRWLRDRAAGVGTKNVVGLCQCGHPQTDHEFSRYECGDCGWMKCKSFSPSVGTKDGDDDGK